MRSMRSDSLVACTCGDLFCFVESLSMNFTLPRTRLVHDYLGSLSCQRLGPPATLTTSTSLLYVSLTDSFECQDKSYLNPYFITYITKISRRDYSRLG